MIKLYQPCSYWRFNRMCLTHFKLTVNGCKSHVSICVIHMCSTCRSHVALFAFTHRATPRSPAWRTGPAPWASLSQPWTFPGCPLRQRPRRGGPRRYLEPQPPPWHTLTSRAIRWGEIKELSVEVCVLVGGGEVMPLIGNQGLDIKLWLLKTQHCVLKG